MKKIINMICLMIILCTGMVMVVSAEDNHNEMLLYVNTDQCPKEILEFVDDNVGRFVSALCEEEGYSDSTSTYSVWNPWNKNQYFVMDKDEKVHYHTNGTSWVWDNTVYNW